MVGPQEKETKTHASRHLRTHVGLCAPVLSIFSDIRLYSGAASWVQHRFLDVSGGHGISRRWRRDEWRQLDERRRVFEWRRVSERRYRRQRRRLDDG